MVATKRRPKHSPADPGSPAFEAVRRISIECRLVIINSLLGGPMRFNELQKVGTGIEAKTLARVLKYLVSEGIVQREVLGSQAIAVQYSLTEKGRQLRPVIDSLHAWGEKWIMPSKALGKDQSGI